MCFVKMNPVLIEYALWTLNEKMLQVFTLNSLLLI